MNQLKPVLIEDFNEIKSPSSLQYSPDEKTLAFTLVQPDKENNKYSKNLWIMEENKEAVQLTSSGKDGDLSGKMIRQFYLYQSAAKKRMIWKRKRRFTASIFMAESQSRRFLFQGPYPFLRSFQMAYIVWESRKIEIHFH